MKELDFFDALGGMAEDLIVEAKEVPMKQKRPLTRPVKLALIAAAVVAALTGTVLAVYQYTRITDRMAARWESLGETQMPEAEKEYIEEKSTEVGYIAADQGITITADSVTCTEFTVYVLYHIELDPEQYDLNQDYYHITWGKGSTTYVKNDAYGTEPVTGGGGMPEEGDGYWTYHTYEFDLPDGARLNDGQTVFHTDLTLLRSVTGFEVSGNWSFEFPLPDGDAVETKEVTVPDQTLCFSDGKALEISEIVISENNISFCAATTKFTTSDGAASLEQQMVEFPMMRDELAYYLVEAVQEDGTNVPTNVAGRWDDGSNRWDIRWAAPIDPTTVSALRFSNGAEEIEIPLQ